ncbi:MAG TPA: ATP synthase F0 subunit B [Pirellulaceae bacterium]|nr:ATP synthase F0 subunit B [Pirellulaceae bacterium]
MSPTLVTFLFEAANFLLLAAVLSWLLFKPVRKALADYRARLDAQAIKAQEKLAASEKLQADIEQERQAFRDESARLRNDTLAAARTQAEQTLAQARERARTVKEAAEQHVTRLDAAQKEALAQAAAMAAAAAVAKLLEQIGGPELETALRQAACRQLAGLQLDGQRIIIESAAPLGDSERVELEHALGPAAVHVTYRVVKELRGGIRVTTSRGVIDASVAGLADYARIALTSELGEAASTGATHA